MNYENTTTAGNGTSSNKTPTRPHRPINVNTSGANSRTTVRGANGRYTSATQNRAGVEDAGDRTVQHNG